MSQKEPQDFWSKIILHIDYDSFFASVEQQANPFLRNKPIVVTGSLERGVVCTASREAKKMGIKTGMPIYKAKYINPKILVIKGDFEKYTYIQKESLIIFNKYTDLAETFSIDEVFLDVTKTLKFFGSPQELTKKIKEDLKIKFGDCITCSIGIGPNKLLAKLVSEINKPNGLYIVTKDNLEETLKNSNLTDFCGIGKHISERLKSLNIYNIQNLQNVEQTILFKEFGNIESNFLKNLSYGIGSQEIKNSQEDVPVKSISHQHTLEKNTKDLTLVKNNLQKLAEMVGKRLRSHNMKAKTIHLSLKDKFKNYYSQRTTLREPTQSSQKIYQEIEKLLEKIKWNEETRFVGVGVSNLTKTEDLQPKLPLFEEETKLEKLEELKDLINNKWGESTIIPANTLKADQKDKNKLSSFLKH